MTFEFDAVETSLPVIRARVWRQPDLDVRSLLDIGPVWVSGGWGWQLHVDGAAIDHPRIRTYGVVGDQQKAVTDACAALRQSRQRRRNGLTSFGEYQADHSPLETAMLPTLSPRLFIGLLGAAAILAGLIALATGVNAEPTSPFGSQVSCGTAVRPDYSFSVTACEQAVGTRRAWGWPLLVGGIVAAAGALLVQIPGRRPESTPEPDVA